MDKLMYIIKKTFTSMLTQLNKFYYNINLFFKKYKTINKLYEPRLNDKINTNTMLCKKINDIKSSNFKLKNNLEKLSEENRLLEKRISIMQELIFKK